MRRTWLQNYEELKKFQEKFGFCLVPKNQKPDDGMDAESHKKLYDFVKRQRFLYGRSKRQPLKYPYDPQRKKMLDDIGFTWQVQNQKHTVNVKNMLRYDDHFQKMLQKVKAYADTHDLCWIPERYPQDRELGIWCMQRRYEKRHNALRYDRIHQLDQVGFLWEYPRRGTTRKLREQKKKRESSKKAPT